MRTANPLRVSDPMVGLDEVVRAALRAINAHAAAPLSPEDSFERNRRLDVACHEMRVALEAALQSQRGDAGLVVHARLREAGLNPAALLDTLADLFARRAL